MNRRVLFGVSLGVVAALSGATACGSDGDSSDAGKNSASATTAAAAAAAGEWQQLTFTDPKFDNQSLAYNLYLPAGYDAKREYPLVIFLEDASMVGTNVTTPIDQGEGATVWASAESQAENPAIVVAPQFESVVVQDDYNPTDYFDITVDLVLDLAKEYSVDQNRIYNTGQSMGGMMTLGMDIKYPDMFAASYVVAAQWPAEDAAPLAGQKIWYTVAEGDEKAYPGMQQIRDVVEQNGAKVAGGSISAQASESEFATFVGDIVGQNVNFNYTVFEAGTDLAKGAKMEHMGTWDYAYGISGIRQWLFDQKKSKS